MEALVISVNELTRDRANATGGGGGISKTTLSRLWLKDSREIHYFFTIVHLEGRFQIFTMRIFP